MCAGGWNNNPSAHQFAFIYRRLLARAGVIPSATGNVLPQDGTELETDSPNDPVFEEELMDIDDLPGGFIVNVCGYIAGWVVRKVLDRLGCDECREAIVARPSRSFRSDLNLLRLKNNGGLVVPSEGVVEVIKTAEKCLRGRPQRRRDVGKIQREATLESFQLLVLRRLSNVLDLFPDSTHFSDANSCVDNHLFSLIKLLIKKYFTIRQQHYANNKNLAMHKRRLRYNLNKTTLFNHQ